jgi:hypothetical protein
MRLRSWEAFPSWTLCARGMDEAIVLRVVAASVAGPLGDHGNLRARSTLLCLRVAMP